MRQCPHTHCVATRSRAAPAPVSVPGGTGSPKGLALGHDSLLMAEVSVSEVSLEPEAKPDGCSPSQPMTNRHCRSSVADRRQSLWIINVL